MVNYSDGIVKLELSVNLGPYQFQLYLTFTEIESAECTLVSEAISKRFVEMLIIPEVLKSYRCKCGDETYVVRPFTSKEKADNDWVYDYHLFVTRDLLSVSNNSSVGTDDFEHQIENNFDNNQSSPLILGSSDDFDLTISNSLENKIDIDFWQQRLNFSQQMADSYTLFSKLSQLKNLESTLNKINFDSASSDNVADFELFNSMASSYQEFNTDHDIPCVESVTSHNTNVGATTTGFSVGVECLLGQSQINGNSDNASHCNKQLIENYDSQETICEFSNQGQENPRSISESESESTENAMCISSPDNRLEDDSQPSTTSSHYFDPTQSPNQDALSVSDADYKSPITSPAQNIFFLSSQTYKAQTHACVTDSLQFPDPMSEGEESSEFELLS